MSSINDTEEGLSEYELKRLERIAKNEAYLESIGLGKAKQKLKEMCKKTKKNARRTIKKPRVKPGQERRSGRLQKKIESEGQEHVMLSYYDDNELAVVSQEKEEDYGDYDLDDTSTTVPVRYRSRRYSSINRADFELSKEEKEALESSIDDNYLYKFKVGLP